ncbi:pimeloyl-ACP methyl ester carboxylesterase [Aquimarina sp. EL_43]|uniref:alpha/beta fold hydrolase n=1 Tax=unclassified Aquimarina TaxID=2627091 RepID=UPI0018CAD7D3|nr:MULTISPECIES: alpha/beta fold hydrolase [unclassified Aquimarina]MBG6132917.1 pimeloyl-ACP methyl ester carboxylesterase [Aquimarina sp. EL_35]MBG6152228.1 pimeloyl-ACP methyl ester carboxylesterase [Aquimarina sp. EL_32]MBG6171066.1 pimeloyl-ACP methyl ester carboxylesterase [Aquimarina sp. EL_43]
MKLHANVFGEGQPFIILHGFLGMGDNWKTLGKKISEQGFQVHLVDQRNHGRSPHSDEFSYDILADDLATYCEEYHLQNCNILGHSMGGKTVMLFASKYSDLIDHLIVADIGPKYYPLHHQDILDGLSALDFEILKSRGEVDHELSMYVPDTGVRMFLLKNLYWKDKGVLGLRMNLEALMKNAHEIGVELPEKYSYSGHTLFLKGERSNYILDEDEPRIKKQFPNSIIAEISNAGHWLHAENPVNFLEEVLEFVKK